MRLESQHEVPLLLAPGNLWQARNQLLLIMATSATHVAVFQLPYDPVERAKVLSKGPPPNSDIGIQIVDYHKVLELLVYGTHVGTTYRPKLKIGKTYLSQYGERYIEATKASIGHGDGFMLFVDSCGRKYWQYGIRDGWDDCNGKLGHLLFENSSTMVKFILQEGQPPIEFVRDMSKVSLASFVYRGKLEHYLSKMI